MLRLVPIEITSIYVQLKNPLGYRYDLYKLKDSKGVIITLKTILM